MSNSFAGDSNTAIFSDSCGQNIQRELSQFLTTDTVYCDNGLKHSSATNNEFFDNIPAELGSNVLNKSTDLLNAHLDASQIGTIPLGQPAFLSFARQSLCFLDDHLADLSLKERDPNKEEFQLAKQYLEIQQTNEEMKVFDQTWESIIANSDSKTKLIAENFSSDYSYGPQNEYDELEDAFSIAKELHAQGKLSEATLACEAALRNNQERPEVWALLGDCHCENEMELKAISAYKKCISLNPVALEPLLNLSVCLTNEGQEAEALKLLDRWICCKYNFQSQEERTKTDLVGLFLAALNTNESALYDTDIQLGLGLLKYNQYEYQRAIECFEVALKKKPESFVLWNTLGATLANSGQNELALEKYRKALSLRPGFIRTRHNLAIGYINIGCYEEAVTQLIRCLEIQTESKAALSSTSDSIWDTLKRAFSLLDREEMVEKCNIKDLNYFLYQYQ